MAYTFNRNVTGGPSNIPSSASSGSNTILKQNSTLLSNGPSDSVSQLNWSVDGNFLSCSSWDRTVRVWQVSLGFGQSNLQSTPKLMYQHNAPVLTTCFGPANSILFAGGCDKIVKMYDLNSNNSQGQVVGQHDQPICNIAWNPIQNILVSASWDGFVKMWDGKQNTPVWQQNLGGKIFCMAQQGPFLAVGDNMRNVTVFNLSLLFQNNMGNSILKLPSPLKMQVKCLAMFPDTDQAPGYALGSIEGRCGIVYLKEDQRQMNFSFKCHRQEISNMPHLFSVNSISFSPKHGTFATGGADGVIVCWDKDHRQRLRASENMGNSICDLKFNPTGNNILAYAVSYDWHKGFDQQELNKGTQVYLHLMRDEDLRPRPKNQQRR